MFNRLPWRRDNRTDSSSASTNFICGNCSAAASVALDTTRKRRKSKASKVIHSGAHPLNVAPFSLPEESAGTMREMAKLDLELVRHALSTAREHGFSQVEIQVAEDRFSATLKPAKPKKTPPVPAVPADEVPAEEPSTQAVRAGLVGYYREASTPLQVGQQVAKGDHIAMVTALGIANDVEAPIGGVVTEVLVRQNDPVMYGQVLARIKS